MWLILNKFNNRDFYEIAGKSLFLCQKFEMNCKDIIIWLSISKALKDKAINLTEKKGLIDNVEKLHKLLLGPLINEAKKNLKYIITRNDINKIEIAKDARNYICHEMSIPYIVNNKWDKDAHLQKIIDLAEGDYLVTKWSSAFHERDNMYCPSKEDYLNEIINWIN